MLSALAHSEWGWHKDDLKMIGNTFISSKINYAGSAWQPWLSDSKIQELDRTQNRTIRLMTGQVKSSPVEALRAEIDMPSFRTTADRACLLSMEKARRMPLDHPRRLALEERVPPRNQRKGWRKRGEALTSKLSDAENRMPILPSPANPWIGLKEAEVFSDMPGIKGRDDDEETKRNASIRRIYELRAGIVVYTDGSATAGCR